MNTILTVGIILLVGYAVGHLFHHYRLPKVTGYILAGILLNPRLFQFIPKEFPNQMHALSEFCLAFITLEVGASLTLSKIKELGPSILSIAFFASLMPFLLVGGALWIFLTISGYPMSVGMLIPFCIVIGSLSVPTDPSVTLSVMHEYKAKGEVADTVMGVSALDDALCILAYVFALAVASFLMGGGDVSFGSRMGEALKEIGLGLGIGVVAGALFNLLTRPLRLENEGVFIILILGAVALTYGLALHVKIDAMFSTLSLGIVIANFNSRRVTILKVMERYTEELIFLFFFTLSGMFLDFSVVGSALVMIFLYVVARSAGKYLGVALSSLVTHQSGNVRKHAAGGLIPQGGIVIGLALAVFANPEFAGFSELLLGVTMGATIIHEVIGPLVAKRALVAAGEI